MSIDVKGAGHVRISRHPGFRKGVRPDGDSIRIRCDIPEVLTQAAHFRDPVQSEKLPKLSGRAAAQGLDSLDPQHRHERQQYEHMRQTVVKTFPPG